VLTASQHHQLIAGEGPAVLTVPDGGYGEPFERIDAESRWAGLAIVDATLLIETATMLRDWDLQSTLLRRTLQSGASHVAAEGPVAIIDRETDLGELERRIVASADGPGRSWADRMLAPLERAATAMLMGSPASPQVMGLSSALLTALGAVFIYLGWPTTGLGAMIAATPLDGIAARLARLRMQDGVRQSWWAYLLPLFSAAAMVILAYDLVPARGWGMVLLAFNILAFLIALDFETEGRKVKGTALLAERKGMTWLMLPFAVTGMWHAGLALLFAYAAGSFFWAQRQVHTGSGKRQD
jgi:hypothetical protein